MLFKERIIFKYEYKPKKSLTKIKERFKKSPWSEEGHKKIMVEKRGLRISENRMSAPGCTLDFFNIGLFLSQFLQSFPLPLNTLAFQESSFIHLATIQACFESGFHVPQVCHERLF